VDALRNALKMKDLELARRLAHTLKGVAATIGADELAHASKLLETAIAEENTDAYKEYLDCVQKSFEPVIEAIANLSDTKA
jgi:two-component system sensor histidine kinase/response regulator